MSRSSYAATGTLPRDTPAPKPRQKRPYSPLDTCYAVKAYTDGLSVLEWCRRQFDIEPRRPAVGSVDTL